MKTRRTAVICASTLFLALAAGCSGGSVGSEGEDGEGFLSFEPEADTGTVAQEIRGGTADTTRDGVRLLIAASGSSVLWTCTATLVGPRTALTAAHCVVPPSGGATPTFYFGATRSATGAFNVSGAAVASRAIAHPKYRAGYVGSPDVAVLEFANTVSTTSLPPTLDYPSAAGGIVVDSRLPITTFGFGLDGRRNAAGQPIYGARLMGTLSYVGTSASRLPTVGALPSNETKSGAFHVFGRGPTGQISCSGDSGGPVFAPVSLPGPTAPGQPTYSTSMMVGVLSYGNGSASPEGCMAGTSASFTSIRAFAPWIIATRRLELAPSMDRFNLMLDGDINDRTPASTSNVSFSWNPISETRTSVSERLLRLPANHSKMASSMVARLIGETANNAWYWRWIAAQRMDSGLRPQDALVEILVSADYFSRAVARFGASVVNPATGVALSLPSSNHKFAASVYADILGRLPTSAELTTWANQLNAGPQSVRTTLASAALVSDDATGGLAREWISTYLRRAPDATLVTQIMNQLRQGVRYETVQAQLLGSVEYYSQRM